MFLLVSKTFCVILQIKSSQGSSNVVDAGKEIDRLQRREGELLRRLRVLEETVQRWRRRRVDRLELKVEELEEALKEARMREASLRSMGDIGPEFP